jgi:hypothetical protein
VVGKLVEPVAVAAAVVVVVYLGLRRRRWWGIWGRIDLRGGARSTALVPIVPVLHYAGIAPASLGQMHGARDGGDGGEGGRRSTVGDRFRVLIIVRWVLPAPQPELRLQ